jgi:glycerophosphoryl diester phosphodiesterase
LIPVILERRAGVPLIIGHKGAAALEPENTLRSLARAVELGVDLIEFDVIDLADGTLVLAHSDDLLEVSHGAAAGRVRSRTLESLRSVAPELPTFEEALDFFVARAPEVGLHVDLKWVGFEGAAVDALRRRGLVDRTLVSSPVVESLHRVAEIEPSLSVGLTYPFDRRGVSRRPVLVPLVVGALAALRRTLPGRIGTLLANARATVAVLHYRVVSPAAVARAHAIGAPVVTWTVDDPRTLRRVARAGVDAIVTNDPGTARATLLP